MNAKVILEATAGPLKGRRFVFEGHDTFVFGRSRDCHAHLSKDDKFSSRHHFLVEVNPPEARLRDLGSLNGTFINGIKYGGRRAEETPEEAMSRLQSEVNLKHQDEIHVGDTVLRILVSLTIEPAEVSSCQSCGKDTSREMAGRPGGVLCESCRMVTTQKGSEWKVHPTEPTELEQVTGGCIEAYQTQRVLGQGGMGTVYLARRLEDGKMVALKVMLAKVAVDDRARNMFLREIEVTKELCHSNIVKLLDYGATGNTFYFVMELCPKGSVQNLLEERGRPLAPREAVPLILAALDGLAYAHQRGFVHRDIKPENILLNSQGGTTRAQIADFGLAKNFELAGLSGMTATGTAAGTPRFMPREQLLQYRYAIPVSDLWSVAATLYCILTGKPPREFPPHRDPMEVVLHGGFIPLRQRDPELPEDLCKVIERTLADEPSKRYQTAAELSAALRSVM
ncbi:MAG: protein kinase domain-containing protein [Pyrinomonadaceae bacterium]